MARKHKKVTFFQFREITLATRFQNHTFKLILISHLINSNTLPVSGFNVKAKPPVSGVNMPFGAFFQKECLSIPLQISTILKTLQSLLLLPPPRAQASPFCSEASQLFPGFSSSQQWHYCLRMSQILTPGQQKGLQQRPGSTVRASLSIQTCKESEPTLISHYITQQHYQCDHYQPINTTTPQGLT